MTKKLTIGDGKYLLLDNCVISKLASAYHDLKNPKQWAKDFYNVVEKNEIQLLTCDLIMFEFLRGAQSTEEYRAKLELLEEMFPCYVPGVETADVVDVIQIANIYEFKNACKKKEPSFIDLFLTSILRTLAAKKVILVTFNYKDFPTLFLNRKIQAIDMGDSIENICFYEFDEKKFEKNLKDFFKAKYHKTRSKKKQK